MSLQAGTPAPAPSGISDGVVAFLGAHDGVQGIDFVQSPGVAAEDLSEWERRESYTLPEGAWGFFCISLFFFVFFEFPYISCAHLAL